jgi:hypothetical protein
MNLSQKFLAWCKPYLDKMMRDAQFDPSVDLEYWNELQAEYKNLYGKNYERTN